MTMGLERKDAQREREAEDGAEMENEEVQLDTEMEISRENDRGDVLGFWVHERKKGTMKKKQKARDGKLK